MNPRQNHHIWVFFYGSYINFDVLKEVDLVPDRWEVARAPGFDIQIAPRANLIRSDEHIAWGINATATHAELDRLYREHAHGLLGQIYLPEAILTYTADGTVRPATTYLCSAMHTEPADPAYVERIMIPGRHLGFPPSYLERISRFASTTAS